MQTPKQTIIERVSICILPLQSLLRPRSVDSLMGHVDNLRLDDEDELPNTGGIMLYTKNHKTNRSWSLRLPVRCTGKCCRYAAGPDGTKRLWRNVCQLSWKRPKRLRPDAVAGILNVPVLAQTSRQMAFSAGKHYAEASFHYTFHSTKLPISRQFHPQPGAEFGRSAQ